MPVNRNAVIQRFGLNITGDAPASVVPLRDIRNVGQYARAWASYSNANAGLTTNSLWGSSDGIKFNGLPNYYDTQSQAFFPIEAGNFGTLVNIDIRGQAEIAYGQTNNLPSVIDLTLCLLPAPGTRTARGRVLSTQTIVPSNPAPGPYLGTSQIVDCADVDTLSIQCTDTLGTTKTWDIQGSIDGQWWWGVPSIGQTTNPFSGVAGNDKTITDGTFVRNLDVSGYRYVRLRLTSASASTFNTIATFYGEALE